MEPPEYTKLKEKIRKATRPLYADIFVGLGVAVAEVSCFLLGGFFDGAKVGSLWRLGPALVGAWVGMMLSIIGIAFYLAGVKLWRQVKGRRKVDATTPSRMPASCNVTADMTDIQGG